MPEPYELISKGLDLEAQKNFAEAEKYILQGIQGYEKQKDQDGVTFGLGRLGDCYEQAGLMDKARAAYEKAIQIGTDIPATYYGLLSILVLAGEFDRAFEIAEIWQQKGEQHLSGKSQEAFIDLSSRLVREKRYEEAIQLFNRTINYFPSQQYPQIYWRIRGLIGNAYEQAGNLEEAMQLYDKAISEGSSDQFTFNRYLINLEKQKQYLLALTIIEKALKIQKDAGWEAELKKRKQRLEIKTGTTPKGAPKEIIPDFTIRAGEHNISLVQQVQISPQLSAIASTGDRFYGTTGGNTPKLFCHQIGEKERIWETQIEGEPTGLLLSGERVILYTRDGKIGDGKTTFFFYSSDGKLINKQLLPDVPSEVVVSDNQIYAGCRDGKLYAFSPDGQNLWSYGLPRNKSTQNDDYFLPCPYYVSAGKELVAFTSFGTIYVLNPAGKLQYKWNIPEEVETSKSQGITFTISMGAPSAVDITVSPSGKNLLIASREAVYEIFEDRTIKKYKIDNDSIFGVYWINEAMFGICTASDVLIYDSGRKIGKISTCGYSKLASNQLANRIAVWSDKKMSIATITGKLLSEIDFAKAIHTVTCFNTGRILVGTRFAILLSTMPEPPNLIPKDNKPPEKIVEQIPPPLPQAIAKNLPTEENGCLIRWIEAQKLTVGAGKAYYAGPNNKEITIEQLALNNYISRGYRGDWTENDYWWVVMALLFWDVIFAKLPGVYTPQFGEFPSKMQDMPHDFFYPQFYQRRKGMIENRIKDIYSPKLFGLVKTTPETELRSAFQRNYGKPCRPIENWQRYSIDSLAIATQVLDESQLMSIMRRLLENFTDNRKGLPDLFLVSQNGEPIFVEVKGEKEKIADHQITWHHFLKDQVHIPVEICRVKNL